MSKDRQLCANPNPCSACPYRRDCPSGVWDASEYVKLPRYDPSETDAQPFGVFMCHDVRDGRAVCKGWLDVHGADELISIRFAAMQGFDVQQLYDSPPTKVPLFESGLDACVHGMRDLGNPSEAAREKMELLQHRHPDIQTRDVAAARRRRLKEVAAAKMPKVWRCPECGKGFKTKMPAQQHCNDCAGGKPVRIKP